MPSVALVVDHPERDLLGLVLVAHRLCREGIMCHLVPNRMATSEIAGLAPDLVLMNHVLKADENRIAFLKEIGSKVAVLDSEGGVLDSFDAYRRALTPSVEIREAVDCYCAWGPRIAERAKEERWFGGGRVVATGPPRFDYYSDPWKRAIVGPGFAGFSLGRPMVMFASTSTLANPRFMSPEEEVALLVDQANFDPSTARRWLDWDREKLRGMVELCVDVAGAIPDVNWVFRPHPFERIETYESALSDNVHLRSDGSIQQWLISVDALIQRGSTTAIEAAIAGVPVLTPDWLPDWSGLEAIRMVSTGCGSPEELVRVLESIVEGHPESLTLSSEAMCEIQSWFAECDGRAHERVCDAVVETLDGRKPKVNRDKALCWLVGTLPEHRPRMSRMAGHFRKMFHVPLDFSFRRIRRIRGAIPWDSAGRAFDASDVNRILDLIHIVSNGPGGSGGPGVGAYPANGVGSYLRPYSAGRSVTVSQIRPGN